MFCTGTCAVLQVTFLPLAEEAANNPDKYQVWIQEYDTIIPICHEGKNRSQVFVVADSIFFECSYFHPTLDSPHLLPVQVLYLALVAWFRKAGLSDDQIRVCLPHGVEGGCDPVTACRCSHSQSCVLLHTGTRTSSCTHINNYDCFPLAVRFG